MSMESPRSPCAQFQQALHEFFNNSVKGKNESESNLNFLYLYNKLNSVGKVAPSSNLYLQCIRTCINTFGVGVTERSSGYLGGSWSWQTGFTSASSGSRHACPRLLRLIADKREVPVLLAFETITKMSLV